MADANPSQISTDERIAQAQELLSIATRNYYVKAYADAVDDFSTACEILSDVYGPSSEELGKPYLMYGKCLIALGQEENKLMEIPEEGEDDADSSDSNNEDDGKEEVPAEPINGGETAAGSSTTATAAAPIDPAQPGSSSGITRPAAEATEDVGDDEEDTEDVANLQVAWEVLELAVGIFSRLPERKRELAESYIELAGISFENSNFEAAIKDFKQALTILQGLPEKNNRELAEINYKIGLACTMMNLFEEAKIALMKACCYLDEEAKITTDEAVSKELQETKAEIENKIAEVEEYKQQSMDVVKQELAKLVGHQDNFEAGEGTSAKPAADISHLIKRKKPEDVEGSASGADAANNINHLGKISTVIDV